MTKCKNCGHSQYSPTGGFVPDEIHCWVIECNCPGYEPAEIAEPKCEGCGEIDYDGKHPIPPHRCNGVDGAARHGYANACTICGRFSAQRHEGCPKPDTSDIDAARAFYDANGSKMGWDAGVMMAAFLAEKTQGIRAEAVRDAFDKVRTISTCSITRKEIYDAMDIVMAQVAKEMEAE